MNAGRFLARWRGTTPIDDFLAGSGAPDGERWEAIGAGLGIVGVLLAVGLLVLLVAAHRGPRREIRTLLAVTAVAGALIVAGAAIEAAGTARVLEVSWLTALRDGSASAAMMRLLAGLLILLGCSAHTVPSGDPPVHPSGVADDFAGDVVHRWVLGPASAFGVAGGALGVLSFAFDGHTTSEGPRLVHAAVDVVHVTAGAVWFGGTVGVAIVAILRRGYGGPLGATLRRFARLATVALGAAVVAGIGLAVIILDDVDDLTGTEWGRRLLVKVGVVALAALLGTFHHLVVVPRSAAGDRSVDRVARRTLVLEAAVLTGAVVLTAVLTRAAIV